MPVAADPHAVSFAAPPAGEADTAAVAAQTLVEERPRRPGGASRTVRGLDAAQRVLDELRARGAEERTLTVLGPDLFVVSWQ